MTKIELITVVIFCVIAAILTTIIYLYGYEPAYAVVLIAFVTMYIFKESKKLF